MAKNLTITATVLTALVAGCSLDSNHPNSDAAKETDPIGAVSEPLLGLPIIGLPLLLHYTGLGLGGGGLLGQIVEAGVTVIRDVDLVTADDDDGAPSLDLFPQLRDLLGRSYRKVGGYVDPTKPSVPVPLANGTMGSRPWQRYVQVSGGAPIFKSSGLGADSSAIVPLGMTLRAVAVTYSNVPTALSTLPLNVPGLDWGYREPVAMLWKCPGYNPNTSACVDSPTGQWIYLTQGRADYLFASRNGLSFRSDGSAIDGKQYFMLNKYGTAYNQVVYAGTSYSFSYDDNKYLQNNYAYASWTPILADSSPSFFTRP